MCTRFTALLALLAITVEAGLLRVPKIYNTVITSDANLEPSRAFPIVQPVLTVGVQPVVAAAAVPVGDDHRGHPAAAYYPLAFGGFYPFLAGTNALYPTQLLYHQPTYGVGPVQRPVVPQPAPAPPPELAPASAEAPQPQPQLPPMPVSDVLNHRLKNPEIPDVPPPPLPVSAKKS